MLISTAYAQAVEMNVEVGSGLAVALPDAPSALEAFGWNMGLVLVLVFLFYVLLIAPQQRRLKEHSEMLQDLKKGDNVVTGGGLVGVIDRIKPGDPEVIVDLGGGVKVTALRSTIHGKDAGKNLAKDSSKDSGAPKGKATNDRPMVDKVKKNKK